MARTIGLTGNIACGKSTVATILRALGARIIDADTVAHQVIAPPGPVFDAIVREFGNGVVGPDGTLNRRKLGAIVFGDPSALRRLDAIVHPHTSEAIRRLIKDSSDRIVVVEAIKLIESGTHQFCDAIWLVTCRPDQQIDRLVVQRNLSPEEAEARIAAQSPSSAKLPYASVVIDASKTLTETRLQVIRAWNRFTTSIAERSEPYGSSP